MGISLFGELSPIQHVNYSANSQRKETERVGMTSLPFRQNYITMSAKGAPKKTEWRTDLCTCHGKCIYVTIHLGTIVAS